MMYLLNLLCNLVFYRQHVASWIFKDGHVWASACSFAAHNTKLIALHAVNGFNGDAFFL
jgi:hypothetical protein